MATHPEKWTADTEEAFAKGTPEHVVITSHGELRLARELGSVLGEDAKVGNVFAIAPGPDGAWYAAVAGEGTTGEIRLIKGGKSTVLAEVELTPMFSSGMFVDGQGRLVVGASGDSARVLRFSVGGTGRATTGPAGTTEPTTQPALVPEVLLDESELKYVWAVAPGAGGTIYAVTGPNGKLLAIPAGGGKAEVLFSVDGANFTCLAVGGDGAVYVGSGTHGIVYRVDPKSKASAVVMNVAEAEIAALSIDAKGNVYAATGAPVDGGGPPVPSPKGRGLPDNGLPEPKENPLPSPPMVPPSPGPKGRGGAGKGVHPFAAHGRQVPPMKLPGLAGLAKALHLALPNIKPQRKDEDGAAPEGNAVYRLDKEGFVTEVYRAPVTIRAMIEREGVLTLGCAEEGQILEVDTRRDETGVIAKADSETISVLAALPDGSIAVGGTNEGGAWVLSKGLAKQGTYVTEVFDATGIARLGTLRLDGSLPEGAGLMVATRSGNVDDPDSGWTAWSEEMPARRTVQIASAPGRFFQARLTFTGGGTVTPAVRTLEASYQLPNAAPVVSSVSVSEAGDEKSPGAMKHIAWEAKDANGDTLGYTLQYRPTSESDWRPLKEHLTETTFDWDTRAVGDARYQVRVIASDAADNAPGTERAGSRVSASFLVDNTPPKFSAIAVKVDGTSARLDFTVSDEAGTVAGVKWRVGAEGEWRTAEAGDKMFDSPSEAVTVVVRDLPSGKHVIALRAVDDRGNESFENVLVEIK